MAASHSLYDLLPEQVCRCGKQEPAAPEVCSSGARCPDPGHISLSAPDGVSHAGLRGSGAAGSPPAHADHVTADAGGDCRAVGSQHASALGDEGLVLYDSRLMADTDRLLAVQTNLWP